MLTNSQIKDKINEGAGENIKEMRKQSEILSLHYFGKDKDKHIKRFEGLENTKEHETRRDLTISNSFLVNEVLRPTDNIWTAKGGSEDIKITESLEKEFMLSLTNVSHGLSLKEYVEQIWFERFIVDPNGIELLHYNQEDDKYFFKPKKIHEIIDYKVDGIGVEWILFEPYVKKVEDKEKKVYWYIDKDRYQVIEITEGNVTFSQETKNLLGFVPAVVNSSIVNTDTYFKESPIEKQVDLLDSYLFKNSLKESYQLKHFFPVYWERISLCPTCNGTRSVVIKGVDAPCSACNGTGHAYISKNVNDVRIIQKAEEGEPDQTPVAGYVQPDIATMGEQRTELDWLNEKIVFSHWGATKEKAKNQTATGKWIDTQPVFNRLNAYADVVETIHTRMLNIWGKANFTSFEVGFVRYGRRYMIEAPDVIMERYLKAKEDKVSDTTLNLFMEQYYSSEFQNNELALQYHLKLLNVEPYPHNTIEEVVNMQLSPEETNAKRYFPEWIKTLDTVAVVVTDDEKLRAELNKFANEKLNKNKNE
jgi:hypothetical protein